MSTTQDIVAKLWGLCNVLRDDGVTYSEYVTELTFLLFLKMMEETGNEHRIPEDYRWRQIARRDGLDQLTHYRLALTRLGDPATVTDGTVRAIFTDAQTRLRKPANLKSLTTAIDGLDWFDARQEGLGDLYEGLLQKNAEDKKSGAGQYFTPRPLIDCLVRLTQPKLGEIIQDPAAGTGGFIVAAHQRIFAENNEFYGLADGVADRQVRRSYSLAELVPDTHRLCLMNLMLHGIEGDAKSIDTMTGEGAALPRADLILSNPPFGTKKGGGRPARDDFSVTADTSNKQLAFVEHILRALKPGGRAAVVVPDNVLFEDGVGRRLRQMLMGWCDLHTILRLPTGIFYAQGVKTNVVFFTRNADGSQKDGTDAVWVYDMRAGAPSYGKTRPLRVEDFAAFEAAFGDDQMGHAERTDEGGRPLPPLHPLRDRGARRQPRHRLAAGRRGGPRGRPVRSRRHRRRHPRPPARGDARDRGARAGAGGRGWGGRGGVAGGGGMSDLPTGWAATTFGDLGRLHCGQSPATSTVNRDGSGTPYVTGPEQWDGVALRDPKWTTDPKRIVPEGCVFITVKGAGVGKTFPGIACAIGRDVYAFEPSECLDFDFALRAIQNRAAEIITDARGDIPGLSKGHIEDHEALVPPLAEQRRIVAKLDRLSAKRSAAEGHLARISKLATRAKQSILAAAYPTSHNSRLDENHDELGTLSRLRDVAEISSGGTPKGIAEQLDPSGDVHWFKVSSMNEPGNETVLRQSQFRLTTAAAKRLGLRLFPAGTIVFPKRGGAIATNKKRIIASPNAIDLNLMALTPIDVSSGYLSYWIAGLDLARISNGSNVPQINFGDVADLTIFVPSRERQAEIVRRIETAFARINRLTEEASRASHLLARLDERLLAKAFRGELVPQDPNDEPAEALLARIRAARTAAPKARRRRGEAHSGTAG